MQHSGKRGDYALRALRRAAQLHAAKRTGAGEPAVAAAGDTGQKRSLQASGSASAAPQPRACSAALLGPGRAAGCSASAFDSSLLQASQPQPLFASQPAPETTQPGWDLQPTTHAKATLPGGETWASLSTQAPSHVAPSANSDFSRASQGFSQPVWPTSQCWAPSQPTAAPSATPPSACPGPGPTWQHLWSVHPAALTVTAPPAVAAPVLPAAAVPAPAQDRPTWQQGGAEPQPQRLCRASASPAAKRLRLRHKSRPPEGLHSRKLQDWDSAAAAVADSALAGLASVLRLTNEEFATPLVGVRQGVEEVHALLHDYRDVCEESDAALDRLFKSLEVAQNAAAMLASSRPARPALAMFGWPTTGVHRVAPPAMRSQAAPFTQACSRARPSADGGKVMGWQVPPMARRRRRIDGVEVT